MARLTKQTNEFSKKFELLVAKTFKKRTLQIFDMTQLETLANYRLIFFNLSVHFSLNFDLKNFYKLISVVNDEFLNLEKNQRVEDFIRDFKALSLTNKIDKEEVLKYFSKAQELRINVVKITKAPGFSLNMKEVELLLRHDAFQLISFAN